MKGLLTKVLRWLLSWLETKDLPGQYSAKERSIYAYHNGSEVVLADPLVLYRKWLEVSPDLEADMAIATSPSKAAGDAHEKMITRIHKIFGLKPLSEGGVTEVESLNILNEFLDFCIAVKKNAPTSPTTPTESPPDSASCTAADRDTKSTSACGSTDDARSSETPRSSPTA